MMQPTGAAGIIFDFVECITSSNMVLAIQEWIRTSLFSPINTILLGPNIANVSNSFLGWLVTFHWISTLFSVNIL